MYRFPPFTLLNKSFRTQDHPGGQRNSNSPLVAGSTVVPTSTTSVCGPPLHHSVQPGLTVTTRVCLGWQVVPSARLEALMQNYQASLFFKEVSRLAATPRRSSTKRMTTGGFASLTGPQGKEFIHIVPQMATFCIMSLTLMAYHLKLSKDTGPSMDLKGLK